MINGATISAPATSPIHQVNQIDGKLDHCAYPPKMSDVNPILGLIVVQSNTVNIVYLKISCALRNAFLPFANVFTKYAPISPSSVFPNPMPIEVATVPSVVTFTKNAARKIAGQTR